MWYRQTVWEVHRVFALGTVYCDYWLWEYLHWQSVSRKWGPFSPTEHVVSLGWCVATFLITFATLLCAVCFMYRRWVRWQWSCWWRNISSPCPQSHCAVAVSPHFLEVRFDRSHDCPGVRLSIQARTAQSHMERSATPSCGRASLGLAKNSSAWVFRDIVCNDIFSSCALTRMRFFTVVHQVCDFDFSASSAQLKTISWAQPPGYKVFSLSLSLSAPCTASLSASSWSGSPEWPCTFTKRVREDETNRNLSSSKISWMMSWSLTLCSAGRKSWLRNHHSLCIAAALSMRMARSSARGVPCNAMITAASSARVLECWPSTRSDLWGMAASCHMTPAPMAGSFVLDRFSRNDPSVATTW